MLTPLRLIIGARLAVAFLVVVFSFLVVVFLVVVFSTVVFLVMVFLPDARFSVAFFVAILVMLILATGHTKRNLEPRRDSRNTFEQTHGSTLI